MYLFFLNCKTLPILCKKLDFQINGVLSKSILTSIGFRNYQPRKRSVIAPSTIGPGGSVVAPSRVSVVRALRLMGAVSWGSEGRRPLEYILDRHPVQNSVWIVSRYGDVHAGNVSFSRTFVISDFKIYRTVTSEVFESFRPQARRGGPMKFWRGKCILAANNALSQRQSTKLIRYCTAPNATCTFIRIISRQKATVTFSDLEKHIIHIY